MHNSLSSFVGTTKEICEYFSSSLERIDELVYMKQLVWYMEHSNLEAINEYYYHIVIDTSDIT